jgi:hypothetical protein
MNLEHFILLHDILLPKENHIINIIKNNNVEIDYIKIKVNYKIENNKIKLILLEKNLNSLHIFRLITLIKVLDETNYLKLSEEICNEYLMKMNEILTRDNNNYCTVCGQELNIKGLNKISHCNNENCKNKYYTLITDNRVMDLYNEDPKVFIFLLNIFVSGLTHPKVNQTFKPFPYIPNIKTIDELQSKISLEIRQQDNIKLIEKLNSSSNDIELYDKLEMNSYSIIKNVISNNYFSMSSRENIITNSDVVFIHINYSADIENKFGQKYYLFHGSPMYSWYPIIKNGLKVMSGTAFQANGAAHGNGIYFSDSYQYSLGYSKNMNIKAVGVFEILEDPIKYNKTKGIYVINDDEIILLRSLIISKANSKIPKNISDYFIKEIPLEKKENKSNLYLVKNKRLNTEYKKLLNDPNVNEINIVDQLKWILKYKKINNIDIEIELIFTNYPICAPTIKLIKGNKIRELIDSNDIITLPITDPSNWKITNNLCEIISILYKCLNETL